MDAEGVRERFEEAWGRELDPERGLTVTEIVASALHGGVRGMYMMGENPFLSDPNINKVRKALLALDFLVVQDIFLYRDGRVRGRDPARDDLHREGRHVHEHRPPGAARPQGARAARQARADWQIIQDISNRVGLPMDYAHPSEIFDELVSVMPNYAGLSYDNLGLTGKLYPNPDPLNSDGTVVLFDERFGTDDGLAHLVPAEWLPAKELPSDEYPFILNTGRLLEHWHTGSMTRRSFALDAIQPEAHVFLNPDDAKEMGVGDGDFVRISSRRGTIETRAAAVAPRHAGHVLHAVPLPRGGGEPADDRRDRPDGEDPGVQVLRGEDRAVRQRGAARVRHRSRGRLMRVQERHPGTEARAGKFPGPSLIPALNAIQARCGWLPREELVALSREVRRPLYEIGGLISFYPHFRTSPPKTVQLAVCHDLTCWLHGSDERIAEVKERYGDDVEIEVVEVSCLGRCDTAPAAAVEERPIAIEDAVEVVEAARGGSHPAAEAKRREGDRRPNDPYASVDEHYGVLRRALAGELTSEDIVATLKDAGLRGMGGAGFPDRRQVGDGGGAGGDAEVHDLQRRRVRAGHLQGPPDPRRAAAPRPRGDGARDARERLGGGLGVHPARVRAGGGRPARGDRRDARRGPARRGRRGTGRRLTIEIFTSPGGYILGEESALLECMEGHRGEPRNKPPFPALYGLWGKPTLMNSVETFADVPIILERGAEWWKDQGINGATGLKFFAVSGHVERPDVYCVPAGSTSRDLVELAGGVTDGREVGAIQPGGASSNFLGPDALDVPLDWKPLQEAGSMLGSGAVIVMAEGTNLLAAGTNVLRFFRNESCGKCVPCRVGSTKAHAILSRHRRAGRRRRRRAREDHRARGDAADDVDLRPRAGGPRPGAERDGHGPRRDGRARRTRRTSRTRKPDRWPARGRTGVLRRQDRRGGTRGLPARAPHAGRGRRAR